MGLGTGDWGPGTGDRELGTVLHGPLSLINIDAVRRVSCCGHRRQVYLVFAFNLRDSSPDISRGWWPLLDISTPTAGVQFALETVLLRMMGLMGRWDCRGDV